LLVDSLFDDGDFVLREFHGESLQVGCG
jgi:hypothetical protein